MQFVLIGVGGGGLRKSALVGTAICCVLEVGARGLAEAPGFTENKGLGRAFST